MMNMASAGSMAMVTDVWESVRARRLQEPAVLGQAAISTARPIFAFSLVLHRRRRRDVGPGEAFDLINQDADSAAGSPPA